MTRKIILFLAIAASAFAVWLVSLEYEGAYLTRMWQTLLSLALLYAVFRLVLEEVVARRLHESKTRYAFRKVVMVLWLAASAAVILRIWIPNPEALLVAYGLLGAGLAIALQDVIKNFAGGLLIFLSGAYQVGNRIEIDGSYGDVIDIGLFYTTLLELRGWVDADQATGRMTLIPNGRILGSVVSNYTKHHHFLWDELSVTLTAESDWRQAMGVLKEIAARHTGDFSEQARQSLSKLEERYYLEDRSMEPTVYLKPHKDGYTLALRYVVEARERRRVASLLWCEIITCIEQNDRLFMAPDTVATITHPSAPS